MKIRAVATDVDGTLTVRRGNIRISINAVRGVRLLESRGVKVLLVSGNSLPVTAGLRVYLGASGPVIAENGCIIFYHGSTIHVCEGRPPEGLIKEVRRLGFADSWQNQFRFHDMGFHPPRAPRERLETLVAKAMELAKEYNSTALWSGYALHLGPAGESKSRGLEEALRMIGVSKEELAAIGDGENDLDMLAFAGYSGCPSDAAETVKRAVKHVASRPGGAGFLEFARHVLGL